MNHSTNITNQKPTAPTFNPSQTTHLPILLWAPSALLVVGIVLLVGLLLTGRLHLGTPTTPAPPQPETKAKDNKETEKTGRYQIEVVEDSSQLLDRAGSLGLFGEATQDVWVFRYRGGLIDCTLEADTFGQLAKGQTVPESWAKLAENNDSLKTKTEGTIRKEGFIVVAAMRPVLSIEEALSAYHTTLGGLFVSGPAGPLHVLTNLHLDTSHWRLYKILLTAGPLKGESGAVSSLWTGQLVNVRLPILAIDPSEEEFRSGGGKDLVPDQEVTLMERRRGMSTVRLKARFLSDGKAQEVLDKK